MAGETSPVCLGLWPAMTGRTSEMCESAVGANGTDSELREGDTDPAQSRREALQAQWRVPVWLEIVGRWSWQLLPVVLLAVVLMRALSAVRLVALPVLIALLAAALLTPVHRGLVGRVPSSLSAALVTIVAVVMAFGGFTLTTAVIATELVDAEQWIETRTEVRRWLVDGPAGLAPSEVEELEADVEGWLTTGLGEVSTDRALLVSRVLGAMALTVLLLFFFVKDGGDLWRWLTDRIRPERRDTVHRAGEAAFEALGGYIRGVALTGLFDALLIGIGLHVLGVPLAVPLAVLTFIAAFFPIAGAAVAGGLAALVALVTSGPSTAVAVIVLALVVQQIEGNLLMPLILWQRVRLHPAVILTALAIGGGIGGIAGAFVAVPAAAMTTAAVASVRRIDADGRRSFEQERVSRFGRANPAGSARGSPARRGDADRRAR